LWEEREELLAKEHREEGQDHPECQAFAPTSKVVELVHDLEVNDYNAATKDSMSRHPESQIFTPITLILLRINDIIPDRVLPRVINKEEAGEENEDGMEEAVGDPRKEMAYTKASILNSYSVKMGMLEEVVSLFLPELSLGGILWFLLLMFEIEESVVHDRQRSERDVVKLVNKRLVQWLA